MCFFPSYPDYPEVPFLSRCQQHTHPQVNGGIIEMTQSSLEREGLQGIPGVFNRLGGGGSKSNCSQMFGNMSSTQFIPQS